MSNEIFDAKKAGAFYDDSAVARFYELCWGGADIHIGLYETGDETIAEASAAMTDHLVKNGGIRSGDKVLDIACGLGGTLRFLARLGCIVKGTDISKVGVEHSRKAIAEAGLSDRIEVAIGDFHNIDSAENTWDAVICQEAIIHSPDRPTVFAEVFRVLRPGGTFVYSDILTGEDADVSMVEAAFARLGASADSTITDYQNMARAAGFEIVQVEERLHDIRTHYDKLAAKLATPVAGLDSDAQASIAESISHWRAALAEGHITWGCFVVRKPGT